MQIHDDRSAHDLDRLFVTDCNSMLTESSTRTIETKNSWAEVTGDEHAIISHKRESHLIA